MDGMEKILQRIREDATAEIALILAEANREAETTKAQYAARAGKEVAELLSHGKAEAEDRAERLEGLARMEAQKIVLAEKQTLVEEAFRLAVEQLSDLPPQDYEALLIKLIQEATESGTEQVIFSAKDREIYGKKVVEAANENRKAAGKIGALTVSKETRPLKGGVVLRDADGEIDCSVEMLVRLARNELTVAVSEILFGKSKVGGGSHGKSKR